MYVISQVQGAGQKHTRDSHSVFQRPRFDSSIAILTKKPYRVWLGN